MENELSDLKKVWQQAQLHQPAPRVSSETLITQARLKKKTVYAEHFGNLAVLGGTVLLLIVYFYFIYSLQDTASIWGINFMIVGLLVRIGIEVLSFMQSRKIQVDRPTTDSLLSLMAFHRLRKRIHGPITLVIVAMYVVGLYAVTPEAGRHISATAFMWMHISIPAIAIFLVMVGRKGIRNEMRALKKLVEIQQRLQQ